MQHPARPIAHDSLQRPAATALAVTAAGAAAMTHERIPSLPLLLLLLLHVPILLAAAMMVMLWQDLCGGGLTVL
jgi:hypothetical protein